MSRSTERNTYTSIPGDEERNQPNEAVSSEINDDVCSSDGITLNQMPSAGKWRGTITSPDPRPIRREEVYLLCQVLPSFIISLLQKGSTNGDN